MSSAWTALEIRESRKFISSINFWIDVGLLQEGDADSPLVPCHSSEEYRRFTSLFQMMWATPLDTAIHHPPSDGGLVPADPWADHSHHVTSISRLGSRREVGRGLF
jgi:hypothetical protein